MAVVIDNFEGGLSTLVEFDDMDDTQLTAWASISIAAMEVMLLRELDDGKRHLPGQHNQKTHGHGGGSAGIYVKGADITDDLPYDTLKDLVVKSGEEKMAHGDRALGAILKAQKFDGKPEVVSFEELDRRVAGGDLELFRGYIGGPEHAEQFKHGELFPGLGAFANGTYVTVSQRKAQEYSNHVEGSVQRMVLRKDARVIEEDAVYAEQGKAFKAADSTKKTVIMDPGRYAASRGYDAMKRPFGDYVIFNRTALTVQEEAS